jgi:hypothetical protein
MSVEIPAGRRAELWFDVADDASSPEEADHYRERAAGPGGSG